MTNLLGLPVSASTVSAMMAAITAPTNPMPMTTTISFPSSRAARTRSSRCAISAIRSPSLGRGNLSPEGLTECDCSVTGILLMT